MLPLLSGRGRKRKELNAVGRESDPLNTEAEIIRSVPLHRSISKLKCKLKFLDRLKVKQGSGQRTF